MMRQILLSLLLILTFSLSLGGEASEHRVFSAETLEKLFLSEIENHLHPVSGPFVLEKTLFNFFERHYAMNLEELESVLLRHLKHQSLGVAAFRAVSKYMLLKAQSTNEDAQKAKQVVASLRQRLEQEKSDLQKYFLGASGLYSQDEELLLQQDLRRAIDLLEVLTELENESPLTSSKILEHQRACRTYMGIGRL